MVWFLYVFSYWFWFWFWFTIFFREKEKKKEAALQMLGKHEIQELRQKGEVAPAPACTPEDCAIKERGKETATLSERKEQLSANSAEADPLAPQSAFAQAQKVSILKLFISVKVYFSSCDY